MSNRISSATRDRSPCADCTERYTACWDHCPKYKEFRAEIDRVKKARQEYLELKTERGYKFRWEKNDGKE